ncbi:MAG: hypothetical protein RDU20_23380 [Desulfomonilaceae bacterium]|nr:hypothetical protein [Desulfomonilaceae bacterium]
MDNRSRNGRLVVHSDQAVDIADLLKSIGIRWIKPGSNWKPILADPQETKEEVEAAWAVLK